MPSRFICPHCHHSLDPETLEAADCAHAQYRVCPECDEPIIVLSDKREVSGESLPILSPTATATQATAAESVVL